jgi:uncharacterized membrane protein
MLDVLLNNPQEKNESKTVFRMSDRADKPIKSLMKSISWRIVGTIDTMVISYFITGKVSLAVSIGGIEVLTKTILYYFHERLWAHIHRVKLKLWLRSNEKRYDGKRYDVKRVERSAV